MCGALSSGLMSKKSRKLNQPTTVFLFSKWIFSHVDNNDVEKCPILVPVHFSISFSTFDTAFDISWLFLTLQYHKYHVSPLLWHRPLRYRVSGYCTPSDAFNYELHKPSMCHILEVNPSSRIPSREDSAV